MQAPGGSKQPEDLEAGAPQNASVPYRAVRWLYRQSCAVITQSPAGRRAASWTRPWQVTRKAIAAEIAAHARYARGLILDVGCGEQLYRDLFTQQGRYVSLDLPPGRFLWPAGVWPPAPSVYGDGHALPFRDSTFDTVLSFGVQEVVSQPEKCLSEIGRVLRPGGALILQSWIPWESGAPAELHEFTRCDLLKLVRQNNLAVETITPLTGPWLTRALQAAGSNFVQVRARGWLVVPMGIALFAGSAMDKVLGKRGNTIGYLMVATKLPIRNQN
jgi:SAM-dependent methyltransferase